MKNRWVLTAKYRIDDTVEREKARLVVKGFTQVYGADYDETYSPVSSYVMLRIFFSIVAVLDLKRASSTGCSTCTRQTTSTMGPARALKGVLLGADWKKSQVDTALYFKAGDDEMTCWVLVYVDDLLAASSSTTMLKELPEAAFELREILPVVKPTIAFACSKLVSGLMVRSDQHWREVDRCLAYLADTRDTALEFGGGPQSLELIGYVDADDAGDMQKRTRTGSYVFVNKGATVSWSSSRIKCATLSSTESEYVAAVDTGKERRRLRFLLAEFKQLDAGKSTVLPMDNKSAITVAEGLGLTGNLKHMERRLAAAHGWATGGPSTRRSSSTGRSTEQSVDLTSEQRSMRGARRQQPTVLVNEGVRRPGGSLTGAVVNQRHLVVNQRHLVVDQVDQVTCSASSAEARERRRGRGDEGDFGLVSRSRCGSSGADKSRRMHNDASWANRLRAPASVRAAVFYGATMDSRSAAALACRRPAMLAGRLSAVLARLLYATLAGGRPSCAGGRPSCAGGRPG
ncbi:unnamed protein product [Closterium sp. NIES-53]